MRTQSLKFLIALALTSVLLMAVFSFVIWRNGELYTTSSGTAEQVRSGGIYSRSIWDDYEAYKLALYKSHPMSVMSVGSSRAMSVRALFFKNSDHMSAGGAVTSIEDAETFAADLRALKQRPRVLLFFVDFNWFIDDLPHPKRPALATFDSILFLYQSAFVHLGDLVAGVFSPQSRVDEETGGALIGSRARRLGDGFRTDGSWRYLGYEKKLRYPEGDLSNILADPQGPAAKADVVPYAKTRRWLNATIRKTTIPRFETALKDIQSLGINVVMILPPVAPHIADALKQESSLSFYPQVVDAVSDIARRSNVPLFEFTRVPMTTQDCYVDRYHGNEWVYGWLLGRVEVELRNMGRSDIADAFDTERLRQFSHGPCQRTVR